MFTFNADKIFEYIEVPIIMATLLVAVCVFIITNSYSWALLGLTVTYFIVIIITKSYKYLSKKYNSFLTSKINKKTLDTHKKRVQSTIYRIYKNHSHEKSILESVLKSPTDKFESNVYLFQDNSLSPYKLSHSLEKIISNYKLYYHDGFENKYFIKVEREGYNLDFIKVSIDPLILNTISNIKKDDK